jgi:hypothetical protein
MILEGQNVTAIQKRSQEEPIIMSIADFLEMTPDQLAKLDRPIQFVGAVTR